MSWSSILRMLSLDQAGEHFDPTACDEGQVSETTGAHASNTREDIMFESWRRKTPARGKTHSDRSAGKAAARLARSGTRGAKSPGHVTTVEHLFHGVEIVGGTYCCQAAEALAGERILSADAPRLPLAECSNPNGCSCTYRHYTDRRSDPRREWDIGLPERFRDDDRRSGRGRRITD